MRIPRSYRALGLAAACAFFAGCQSEVINDSPSSQQTPTAGRIAYRYDSAWEGGGVHVDSLRIEVAREGYPTRWASGALGQEVAIGELDAGYWTVRVALYDHPQGIRWYGETRVLVEGGKTSQAVVRLRKASGSVNLTIVLDSTEQPPPADTQPLQFHTQAVAGRIGDLGHLPLFGAFRTDSGVVIHTYAGCPQFPKVLLNPPEIPSIRPGVEVLAIGYDRAAAATLKCMEQPLRPAIVFVPIRTAAAIRIYEADGGPGAMIELAPVPVCLYGGCDTTRVPPISDTSFKWVEFRTSSGFALWNESVHLGHDGRVVRTIESLGPDRRYRTQIDSITGDTMLIVSSGTPYDTPGRWADTTFLSAPEMARVRGSLDAFEIRYPSSLTPSASSCPTDMPSSYTQIAYRDGRLAEFSIPGTWCGTLPRSWAGLDSVRAIIQSHQGAFL